MPKKITDIASARQTDNGVVIDILPGEGNDDALAAMVQNCAEGKCACMSDETKRKVTGMAFVREGDTRQIRISGFVSKEEIDDAMARSDVEVGCCG